MTLYIIGICSSALCVMTGFWHQQTVGWNEDKTMLVIAVAFGLLHVGFFAYRMWKHLPSRTNA